MARWKRRGLYSLMLVIVFAASGCDGGVRFKFVRYPDTPVIAAPPAGLSSSDLAAIIAAIR